MHGIPIPVGLMHEAMREQDALHAHEEERNNTSLRWLESLDVEGLMSLRYILFSDEDHAYGNNKFYDGMVYQLLRAKSVDPRSGVDPAAALLENAAPSSSSETS